MRSLSREARHERRVQVITLRKAGRTYGEVAAQTGLSCTGCVFTQQEAAVRTMGLYLQRLGFTPQKPMRKDYEQSPAAVKKWLNEEYPIIGRCPWRSAH